MKSPAPRSSRRRRRRRKPDRQRLLFPINDLFSDFEVIDWRKRRQEHQAQELRP